MARMSDSEVESRVRRAVDEYLIGGDVREDFIKRAAERELDRIEAMHTNASERSALRSRRSDVITLAVSRVTRGES